MATVASKVIGGALGEYEASTVSELKSKMGLLENYSAQINGEPASDNDYLEDTDYVTFTQSVKGGL